MIDELLTQFKDIGSIGPPMDRVANGWAVLLENTDQSQSGNNEHDQQPKDAINGVSDGD